MPYRIGHLYELYFEHPNTQQKQCVAVFSSHQLTQNKQVTWLTSLQQFLQQELPDALQPASYFAFTLWYNKKISTTSVSIAPERIL